PQPTSSFSLPWVIHGNEGPARVRSPLGTTHSALNTPPELRAPHSSALNTPPELCAPHSSALNTPPELRAPHSSALNTPPELRAPHSSALNTPPELCAPDSSALNTPGAVRTTQHPTTCLSPPKETTCPHCLAPREQTAGGSPCQPRPPQQNKGPAPCRDRTRLRADPQYHGLDWSLTHIPLTLSTLLTMGPC
uniref:Uncharacterized protein n=1 Tax=Apteryx owenii TaxID=8824 RepID=A0A8B9PFE3_APTOW